jgi:L-ectoine synthase
MIIRTRDVIRGTKGEIKTEAWSSDRLLHAEDGMGVTLTDAVLEPGSHRPWWYRNHLEAVYCLKGEAILEDLATGETHVIKPGTLYALNKHERHQLHVKSRMRVVCTFVPPLTGGELHDADGSYPAAASTPNAV